MEERPYIMRHWKDILKSYRFLWNSALTLASWMDKDANHLAQTNTGNCTRAYRRGSSNTVSGCAQSMWLSSPSKVVSGLQALFTATARKGRVMYFTEKELWDTTSELHHDKRGYNQRENTQEWKQRDGLFSKSRQFATICKANVDVISPAVSARVMILAVPIPPTCQPHRFLRTSSLPNHLLSSSWLEKKKNHRKKVWQQGFVYRITE